MSDKARIAAQAAFSPPLHHNLYNPIQHKELMEKKQYQQPTTVSTQLEPNGILCVSFGGDWGGVID